MSKAQRMARGSYLVQIGNIYYLRYLVPEHLIEVLGLKVIKRSLNIRHIRQARKVAFHLVAACNEVFRFFSSEREIMDQAQAKAILFQYLENKLRDWSICHAERPVLTDEQLRNEIADVKNKIEKLQSKLSKADFVDVIPEAKNLMLVNDIKEKDYNLKEICYNVTNISKTFYEIIEKRLNGNLAYEQKVLNRMRPIEDKSKVVYVNDFKTAKKDTPLFSALIDMYIEECKSEWSDKTYIEYTRIYKNTFLGSIEDVPANKFTTDDFLEFRKKLADRDGLDGNKISKSRLDTINKRLKTFFGWCVERDYMEVNFASKIKIRKSSRNRDDKVPFDSDDLKLIFSQEWFTNPNIKRPHYFWVPLIAYYTGMRLGEIVLLEKEDIIHNKEKGYWLIDINENDKKFTKTDYSIRTIPVHPDLIGIGLGRFVESSKNKRLFPIKSNDPSKVFGSAFSKFKTSLGFNKNKNFHSFRRTFSDILKQCMINDILSNEYTGHTNPSMTKGVYSNRFNQDNFWNNLVCKLELDARFDKLSWPIKS